MSLWGIGLFSIIYGLDWIATVPPTLRLTSNIFGRQNAPLVFGWIYVGHQIGAAMAAFGGGAIRSIFGAYSGAFLTAGLMCGVAALSILVIRRSEPAPATAAT